MNIYLRKVNFYAPVYLVHTPLQPKAIGVGVDFGKIFLPILPIWLQINNRPEVFVPISQRS